MNSEIPSVECLEVGDLIIIKMKVGIFGWIKNLDIRHYGVYIGDQKVVHNRPGSGWMSGHEGGVEMCTLEEFCALSNDNWTKVSDSELNEITSNENVIPHFSGDEVATRAISRVGEKRYHLRTNNSEHFAMECRFGIQKSNQLRNAYVKHFLDSLQYIL